MYVFVNSLCVCLCVLCLCIVYITKETWLIESNVVFHLKIALICPCLLSHVHLFYYAVHLGKYKSYCYYYTDNALVVSLILNWSESIYYTFVKVFIDLKCPCSSSIWQYTHKNQYIIQMLAKWPLQT